MRLTHRQEDFICKLIELYRERGQETAVLPMFRQWLKRVPENHNVRATYLGLVERHAPDQVAQLIGALSKEIVFTSGATESINSVLKGIFLPAHRKKNHLIISADLLHRRGEAQFARRMPLGEGGLQHRLAYQVVRQEAGPKFLANHLGRFAP